MPCSSEGYDEHLNERIYGIRTTSEHIAAMVACEAMQFIELIGRTGEMSLMAQKWWGRHQGQDETKVNPDKRWGR
jgi:hypothetical protein